MKKDYEMTLLKLSDDQVKKVETIKDTTPDEEVRILAETCLELNNGVNALVKGLTDLVSHGRVRITPD